MSDLDRTISRALKAAANHDGSSKSRDKAENALRAALQEVKDESLASAISGIHGYLLTRRRLRETGSELSPPLALLNELNPFDFKRSVELGFLELLEDLSDLPILTVVAIAPTPKTIDAWVKKPGDDKEVERRTEELLETTRNSPETALQSGLALWFVEKVPVQRLLETIPLFQAVKAQKRLPADRQRELIHSILLRDREGTFLVRYLQEVARTDEEAKRLVAEIRSNDRVFETVVENLPKALLGDEAGRLGELAVALFEQLRSRKEPSFKRANGQMIILFGRLLTEDARSPGMDVAKTGLADLFREWDTAETQDSEARPSPVLWIVREAGRGPRGNESDMEGKKALSAEQAEHIGIAIEKSRQEPRSLGIMGAMAANLGMQYIGREDEKAEFDPKLHEDTVGGILPGEAVTIIHSGWRLGDKVILRASVE